MKPETRILDEILNKLDKSGGLTFIKYENNEERTSYENALYYLKAKGLVELTETLEGIHSQRINDIGLEFILTGGFAEEDRKEIIRNQDEELNRINLKTSTWSNKRIVAISIISLIISAIALMISILK